jgi:hypothetical protein
VLEPLGALHMVGTALLHGIDELWVGDSHAVLLNTGRFPVLMESVGRGRFIWHVGPRILYSIATTGFPPFVERMARLLRRLPRRRPLTAVFVFGEIDVRCHLAPRLVAGMVDPDFVAAYVRRAVDLATAVDADRTVILVPPPPSSAPLEDIEYPVVGTLDERLAAQAWLRRALTAAAAAHNSRVQVIDSGPALSADDGIMRRELTDDGSHTNTAGRVAFRTHFEAALDA